MLAAHYVFELSRNMFEFIELISQECVVARINASSSNPRLSLHYFIHFPKNIFQVSERYYEGIYFRNL